MNVVKALSAALPTKSGCLFLLLLIIGRRARLWDLLDFDEYPRRF